MKAAPGGALLWIRGFEPNYLAKRNGLQKNPVFPRLCWPLRDPGRRTVLGGQLSLSRMRKRRQSRTGHGRERPARARGRTEVSGLSAARTRAELTPPLAEAENFADIFRAASRFTRKACVQKLSADPNRTVQSRFGSSLFQQQLSFPRRKHFSRQYVRNPARFSPPGIWRCNDYRRPCQGGRHDFFEIVKRQDQFSRRATVHNQCWAMAMVPGSTFTPGPMVEDSATRCR